jgi:hypothetical protein
MKRIIVVSGACLALAACANIHSYEKDDTDIDKKDADMMACKSEMASYSSRDEAKEAFDKCMAGRGYEKQVKKYGM